MTNFNVVKEFIENSYGDEVGRTNALEALEKLRNEAILECADFCEKQALEYGGQDYYAIGAGDCARGLRNNKTIIEQ